MHPFGIVVMSAASIAASSPIAIQKERPPRVEPAPSQAPTSLWGRSEGGVPQSKIQEEEQQSPSETRTGGETPSGCADPSCHHSWMKDAMPRNGG